MRWLYTGTNSKLLRSAWLVKENKLINKVKLLVFSTAILDLSGIELLLPLWKYLFDSSSALQITFKYIFFLIVRVIVLSINNNS